MKILYSAGNRLGAGHQLTDFLANNTKHDIRIAAYAQYTPDIKYIDWTLNALHCSSPDRNALANIFGFAAMPAVSSVEAEMLINEIKEFSPDLIISDAEPILGYIAGALDIRLWYCSPIHLLDGIVWKPTQLKSYLSPLEDTKRIIRKMPRAEKYLIYSPFGDLEEVPNLHEGFEWIQPYHLDVDKPTAESHILVSLPDPNRLVCLSQLIHQLDVKSMMFKNWYEPGYKSILESCNWYFSTGHTRFISDAIYNGKPLCVAPDVSDPETILNSIMIQSLGLGDDLGQLEFMEYLAADELEKSFKGRKSLMVKTKPKHKQLHEKIDELNTGDYEE